MAGQRKERYICSIRQIIGKCVPVKCNFLFYNVRIPVFIISPKSRHDLHLLTEDSTLSTETHVQEGLRAYPKQHNTHFLSNYMTIVHFW